MVRTLLFLVALLGGFLPTISRAQGSLNPCDVGKYIDGSKISEPVHIVKSRPIGSTMPLLVKGGDFTLENFAGLNLTNVCFQETILVGTGWRGVVGKNIQFRSTDLTHSNWLEFAGEEVVFEWATLDEGTFKGVNFERVKFISSSLAGSDFTGANLAGGVFTGNWNGQFSDAKFEKANMASFSFECGAGQDDGCAYRSENVSFRGADLTDAKFETAYYRKWDFTDARLSRTQMSWLHLPSIRNATVVDFVELRPIEWTPAKHFSQERNQSPLKSTVSLNNGDLSLIFQSLDALERPGFNCANAHSETEKYICAAKQDWNNSSKFARYDRELNLAFQFAVKRKPSVRRLQLDWIAKRDDCFEIDEEWERDSCLYQSYQKRIDDLWSVAGNDAQLSRGEHRVYISERIGEILTVLPDGRLKQKLLAPLIWNSWTVAFMSRDSRDRLFANASTVGANYHQGDLYSPKSGLQYDQSSGFYGSDRQCGDEMAICPIVQFRGPYLVPASEAGAGAGYNPFIVKGARAHFNRLIHIPMSKTSIKRLMPKGLRQPPN